MAGRQGDFGLEDGGGKSVTPHTLSILMFLQKSRCTVACSSGGRAVVVLSTRTGRALRFLRGRPFPPLQSYSGAGAATHTRGCCPHPRTQLIGSKGHLTQAGPIKSLPWEFGTGARRRGLKKRMGVWSLWASGPAHVKPGVVHRVSRSTEEGGEREKGEREVGTQDRTPVPSWPWEPLQVGTVRTPAPRT